MKYINETNGKEYEIDVKGNPHGFRGTKVQFTYEDIDQITKMDAIDIKNFMIDKVQARLIPDELAKLIVEGK